MLRLVSLGDEEAGGYRRIADKKVGENGKQECKSKNQPVIMGGG
jgi:hypothetical protein